MKKIITIILALYTLSFTTGNLVAQENIDSDEVITENLKQRLQDSLESARQNLITPSNPPTAYVGTVLDIVQESAEVQTKDGIRYAKMSDKTTIIRRPGNIAIDLDDIRINDFIIAMGYQDNDTSINSKRVIVSQTIEPQLQKTSGSGTITQLTILEVTIEAQNGSLTTISITNSTIIKSTTDILNLENLEIGQVVVYTADIDEGELEATIIMIISPLELEEDLTNAKNELD